MFLSPMQCDPHEHPGGSPSPSHPPSPSVVRRHPQASVASTATHNAQRTCRLPGTLRRAERFQRFWRPQARPHRNVKRAKTLLYGCTGVSRKRRPHRRATSLSTLLGTLGWLPDGGLQYCTDCLGPVGVARQLFAVAIHTTVSREPHRLEPVGVARQLFAVASQRKRTWSCLDLSGPLRLSGKGQRKGVLDRGPKRWRSNPRREQPTQRCQGP